MSGVEFVPKPCGVNTKIYINALGFKTDPQRENLATSVWNLPERNFKLHSKKLQNF